MVSHNGGAYWKQRNELTRQLPYAQGTKRLKKNIEIAADILLTLTVVGLGLISLSFVAISSHKSSIGFKSELRVGHGSFWILYYWR